MVRGPLDVPEGTHFTTNIDLIHAAGRTLPAWSGARNRKEPCLEGWGAQQLCKWPGHVTHNLLSAPMALRDQL